MPKLRSYARWLRPAIPLVVVVAAIGLPIPAIILHPLLPEYQEYLRAFIQWWGVGLQSIGFYIAWTRLRSALTEHGRPGWWKRAGAWWKTRPGSTHVLRAEGIIMGAPTLGSPNIRCIRGKGDGSPEARLDALEQNLAQLQTELDNSMSVAKAQAEQLGAKLQAEKNERIATTRDLGVRLERQAIGDADPQSVGVLFFVAGIVYATAPADLIWLISTLLHAL